MKMFFGRQSETKQFIASLSSGRNVILSGKYGMGRTSLVRHVGRNMQGKWKFLFADFSKTPDQVCRELVSQLKKEIIYKKKPNRFVINRGAAISPPPPHRKTPCAMSLCWITSRS